MGVDAIGFIFHRSSPRYVSPEQVKEIVRDLPAFVTSVGVVVNLSKSEILSLKQDSLVDCIQLHGDESPAFVEDIENEGIRTIKAFRVKQEFNFSSLSTFSNKNLLLDAWHPDEYGGTGITLDWKNIPDLKNKNLILAGGLNPENVRDAIKECSPYAIDVSSGVEVKPGVKDLKKVRALLAAIR
jgi:phosphoribosylanthranilate isomerase